MIRILLVDDSRETLDVLALQYGACPDCEVVAGVSSAEEAWAVLAAHQVDLVSIDIQLEGSCGLELCREIGMRYPDVFRVICSLDGSDAARSAAHAAGADLFLAKPVHTKDVEIVVRACRSGSTHEWNRREAAVWLARVERGSSRSLSHLNVAGRQQR